MTRRTTALFCIAGITLLISADATADRKRSVRPVRGKEAHFDHALSALKEHKPAVGFFDGDGTTFLPNAYKLRKGFPFLLKRLPFGPFPKAVHPVEGLVETYKRLAQSGLSPVVTSGRDHSQIVEIVPGILSVPGLQIYGNYGGTMLKQGKNHPWVAGELRGVYEKFGNFHAALKTAVREQFSQMSPRDKKAAFKRVSRWAKDLESPDQLASWVEDNLLERKAVAVTAHTRPFLTLKHEREALRNPPTGPAREGFETRDIAAIPGAREIIEAAYTVWTKQGAAIFGEDFARIEPEHHSAVVEFKIEDVAKGTAVDQRLKDHGKSFQAAIAAGDSPKGDAPMFQAIVKEFGQNALPIFVGKERAAKDAGAIAYAKDPVALVKFLSWLADERIAAQPSR